MVNIKANGPSSTKRHQIIDFLIKYNIMTPQDIISALEFNIKLRANLPSMTAAREKWDDDIKYIYNVKSIKMKV